MDGQQRAQGKPFGGAARRAAGNKKEQQGRRADDERRGDVEPQAAQQRLDGLRGGKPQPGHVEGVERHAGDEQRDGEQCHRGEVQAQKARRRQQRGPEVTAHDGLSGIEDLNKGKDTLYSIEKQTMAVPCEL